MPTLTWAKIFHCNAGDVSCLIASITQANANGKENTITLDAGVYTLTTINNVTEGENGLPTITSSLTIKGTAAENTIIERDPNAPRFRVLHVALQGDLTLKEVTVRGGSLGTEGIGGQGGVSESGGGILSHGELEIIKSTIA